MSKERMSLSKRFRIRRRKGEKLVIGLAACFILNELVCVVCKLLTIMPAILQCGKASTSRAANLGLIFFQVEPYQ